MANNGEEKSKKKSKTSLRERNLKAAESKDKPKRIRKAAKSAVKPVGIVGDTLTREFHVLPQKQNPGFSTKSRKITPSYFRNSWTELRKVEWPNFKNTWKLVFAVFVFAIGLGIAISLLDFGLEKLFRQIIL